MIFTFSNIIFYILMFFALFVQVFYLLAFLENRKELVNNNDIDELNNTKLPSISLLVPCCNEENTISKTIDSILELNYPKDLIQIIIIDDGSTDSTLEKINEYSANSSITILSKENGGKTTALNFGLKYANSELIASVDADTYLPPNSLKDIVKYFLRNPKTMAVGSSVVVNNPKTFVQLAQSAEYNLFIFTKKMLATFGGALVLPGAFSVYRREVFDAIGDYKIAHNLEDLELTYRMQASGYSVEHAHDVFAFTNVPSSVKSLFKQRLRWAYGFLNNTLDYKHTILNAKYGNFGMFTIPTALIAYILILYLFFIGWYRIILGVIEKVTEVKIVGIYNVFHFTSFDFFKIDTGMTALLPIVLFFSVISYIFIGRYFAKNSKSSFISILYFFMLYNLIAPFWIIKSIYNTLTSNKVAWK